SMVNADAGGDAVPTGIPRRAYVRTLLPPQEARNPILDWTGLAASLDECRDPATRELLYLSNGRTGLRRHGLFIEHVDLQFLEIHSLVLAKPTVAGHPVTVAPFLEQVVLTPNVPMQHCLQDRVSAFSYAAHAIIFNC